jgi:hypothetical protein
VDEIECCDFCDAQGVEGHVYVVGEGPRKGHEKNICDICWQLSGVSGYEDYGYQPSNADVLRGLSSIARMIMERVRQEG